MSVTIESWTGPHRPDRTVYCITGPDRAAVQDAIDTLSRAGNATFLGPVAIDLGTGWAWTAHGEVEIDNRPWPSEEEIKRAKQFLKSDEDEIKRQRDRKHEEL